MTYDAKEHWENIYQTKKSNEVSWHQKKPKTSLNLISGINLVKKRLGNRANDVKWIVSDLMEFKTNNRYDLWHDRAVLHFLTEEEEINRYVERVRQLLKPNGYLIVSTFSENGPKKCSGLYIKQYSEDSMKKLFSGFEHIKSFEEEHLTPWGDSQIFIYGLFKKGGNKR